MAEVRTRAPGKIILSGEHAVVHGSTAIAAAINLFTHVSFRLDPSLPPGNGDGSVGLELKDLGLAFSWSPSRLKEGLGDAATVPSTPVSCSPERIKLIAALVEEHDIPEAKIWLSSGISAFIHLYTSIHGYQSTPILFISCLIICLYLIPLFIKLQARKSGHLLGSSSWLGPRFICVILRRPRGVFSGVV
ncbi:hypothetical protein BHE74_00015120 [Ensete ventricosum]|nr:hypothetical protein BHE74_00015120 [Ensete ventricosum]